MSYDMVMLDIASDLEGRVVDAIRADGDVRLSPRDAKAIADGIRAYVRETGRGTCRLTETDHDFEASYRCSECKDAVVTQGAVLERTPMQLWWWMCAFKYVWRMWSKAEPVSDARKAIDCLEKAAGICRAVELDGSDPCRKGDGFNIVSPAAWPLRVKAVDCLRKCSKEVRRG